MDTNNNSQSHMNNEQRAIREIQTALRYISRFNSSVPPLFPDGIFGEKTETAVKEFQKLNNMNITGVVDESTWNEIKSAYRELKDINMPPDPVFVYPPELINLSMNDTFDEVLILQIILKKIADRYENVPNVTLSGIYDPKTREAVIKLQEIFNLNQTGKVDKQTWNKIAGLYSVITRND